MNKMSKYKNLNKKIRKHIFSNNFKTNSRKKIRIINMLYYQQFKQIIIIGLKRKSYKKAITILMTTAHNLKITKIRSFYLNKIFLSRMQIKFHKFNNLPEE